MRKDQDRKIKIMLTGRNKRIASDISEHLISDRECTAVKCPPTKSALFELVPAELPNVIIICLGDESRDTVKAFDVLRECIKLGAATVIVVANDTDREIFMENTELERVYFLSRPVSLFALYDKLNEIEDKIEAAKKAGSALMTEWVNPSSIDTSKKHILVVDDDPEQLAQIKEHLKEFYEVTLVASGKNVIRYLQKYRVDLILLDYLMPEMDGPEVYKRLRANEDYKDIPVVFLTGVSEKETVVKTLVDLKPEGYMLKPSKKSEIVAKIIDVLG